LEPGWRQQDEGRFVVLLVPAPEVTMPAVVRTRRSTRSLWCLAALLAALLVPATAASAAPPAHRAARQAVDPGIHGSAPQSHAATVAAAAATRSVLVILVDWTAPDSTTVASAQNQIAVTDNQWFKSVSYGQFGGWDVTTTGWYHIAPPPFDCSNGFKATIQNEAKAAAASAGYSPDSYTTDMYYFPGTSGACFAGWENGANPFNVWINGAMTTGVTAHELGHTFGLGHGHAYNCSDGLGNTVALGTATNCGTDIYGDPFDTMGNAGLGGGYSSMQLDYLGWLPGREATVDASTTTPYTTTIAPLEQQAAGAVQALKVVDGSTTLWLEYRQPTGVDSFTSAYPGGTDGLLVRLQNSDIEGFWAPGSNLLDMTPGSSGGMTDAALRVGRSWTDPLGNDAITVLSAGPNGVKVTVSVNGTFVGTPDGSIYRLAGGAPIYVTNCAIYGAGGCGPVVSVPDLSLLAHYPADGTVIMGAQTGRVYRIAGGAPIYVTNWATIGGPQPSVAVDQQSIDPANLTAVTASHLLVYPDDNEFLFAANPPTYYRMAGRAPLPVTSCADVGGCTGAVTIDPGAIAGAGSSAPAPAPFNHLLQIPVTGTVLEGSPSATYWLIAGGRRSAATSTTAAATARAIGINDSVVQAFPIGPSISAVTPSFIVTGTTTSLSISGTLFAAGATVRDLRGWVNFGPTTVVDPGQLTVPATAVANAAGGSDGLEVTNPDGTLAYCNGCLSVHLAPSAFGVAPNSVTTGSNNVVLTLTSAAGRLNLQPGATVSFGPGITVVGMGQVDITGRSVHVTVDVSATAPLGARTVQLQNPDGGTSTCATSTMPMPHPKTTPCLTVVMPPPPKAPNGVHATPGDGQAAVTWQVPPTSTTAGAPTTYTVTAQPGGVTVTVPATSTYALVTGLTDGVSYVFTVTATNATGTSPPSPGSQPAVPKAGLPGVPTIVSVVVAGHGQVTLQWTAPFTGAPILSYIVSWGGFPQRLTVGGPITSATVRGLAPSQTYTFTVTAVNRTGPGPESASSAPVTPN
jgi:hypothetical protein